MDALRRAIQRLGQLYDQYDRDGNVDERRRVYRELRDLNNALTSMIEGGGNGAMQGPLTRTPRTGPPQGWWDDPRFGRGPLDGVIVVPPWMPGARPEETADWPWYAWWLHAFIAGAQQPGCGAMGGPRLGGLGGARPVWNAAARRWQDPVTRRFVAARVVPRATDLRLSGTVEGHLTDVVSRGPFRGQLARPFTNNRLLMQEIMDARPPIPDPHGVPGALRWDVPGTFRGSNGTWELVVDTNTNTVLHFNFVGGR
jgi:hypothetical protein